MFGADIFRNKKVNLEKLAAFGFVNRGEVWVYEVPIVDGQFRMTVSIAENGDVKPAVYDFETGDEYILHLTTSAEGAFVGKVRTDYAQVLEAIAQECFDNEVFKSAQAENVIGYIREKYGDEFEFPWEKFSNNAVVRRKDNKKWYALLLTVKKRVLGLGGDELTEIMDVRAKTEDIERLVDGKRYFPGYHMNKRTWMTICLNGTVPLKEIYKRIDDSFLLVKK